MTLKNLRKLDHATGSFTDKDFTEDYSTKKADQFIKNQCGIRDDASVSEITSTGFP